MSRKKSKYPKFSTTITKKFFNQKMKDLKKDGYFWEYKAKKDYWNKKIPKLITPTEAVFLVGNVPHRFVIVEIGEFRIENIPGRYAKGLYKDVQDGISQCYGLRCMTPEAFVKTIVDLMNQRMIDIAGTFKEMRGKIESLTDDLLEALDWANKYIDEHPINLELKETLLKVGSFEISKTTPPPPGGDEDGPEDGNKGMGRHE